MEDVSKEQSDEVAGARINWFQSMGALVIVCCFLNQIQARRSDENRRPSWVDTGFGGRRPFDFVVRNIARVERPD
jgi:hypothetical protein